MYSKSDELLLRNLYIFTDFDIPADLYDIGQYDRELWDKCHSPQQFRTLLRRKHGMPSKAEQLYILMNTKRLEMAYEVFQHRLPSGTSITRPVSLHDHAPVWSSANGLPNMASPWATPPPVNQSYW